MNRLSLSNYRSTPRPPVFIREQPRATVRVRFPAWLSLTLTAAVCALSGAGLVLIAQLVA